MYKILNIHYTSCSLCLFILFCLSCTSHNEPKKEKFDEKISVKTKEYHELSRSKDTLGIIGRSICRNPIGPGDEGYFELKLLMDQAVEVEGETENWQLQTASWQSVVDTLKIKLLFEAKDSSNQSKSIKFKLLKEDLRNHQADCMLLHVPLTKLYK